MNKQLIDYKEGYSEQELEAYGNVEELCERYGWVRDLFQHARLHSVSPTALLFAHMAHAAAQVPVNVKSSGPTPDTHGVPSLNVAIMGKSGSGKSSVMREADRLSLANNCVRAAMPISGEAYRNIFAEKVQQSKEGPDGERKAYWATMPRTGNALIEVDELGTMLKAMGRSNSTLEHYSNSAFMGAVLGASQAQSKDSVTIPADTYHMSIIGGLQTGLAEELAKLSTSGFAQRFLFVDTADPLRGEWEERNDSTQPKLPLHKPLQSFQLMPDYKGHKPTPETLLAQLENVYAQGGVEELRAVMNNQDNPDAYPIHTAQLPAELYERMELMRAFNLSRTKLEHMPQEVRALLPTNDLDAHKSLLISRLCFMLAWLDGNTWEEKLHPTMQHWKDAETLYKLHTLVRAKCIQEAEEAKEQAMADTKTRARRAQIRSEEQEEQVRENTRLMILRNLEQRPLTKRELKKGKASKAQLPYVADELEALVQAGRVARQSVTTDSGRKSTVYRLV